MNYIRRLTLILACMSLAFITGSNVRLLLFWRLRWLFIHSVASFVLFSTFATSASSRWSYCSSWNSKSGVAVQNQYLHKWAGMLISPDLSSHTPERPIEPGGFWGQQSSSAYHPQLLPESWSPWGNQHLMDLRDCQVFKPTSTFENTARRVHQLSEGTYLKCRKDL